MVVDPHQQSRDLERVQYLLTFRHPIAEHLLLVLAQRLEPDHEDEALADVVAHGPDLVPSFDDLAALDWGDVQFLHEDSRDWMTPWLEKELVRLAARPEGHLGDGRGGGETIGNDRMDGT